LKLPERAVVTAGMPYANNAVHIGHLAGAHVPADVHSRWLGMAIGRKNVLFVCGSDDHGSATELAAMKREVPIPEHIASVHASHVRTMERFDIGLDTYSGTSRPDCVPLHRAHCHAFIEALQAKGMLTKRVTKQWYDPELDRFLADRFVRGRCPNPRCNHEDAYSDECGVCGHQHDPSELIEPRSSLSDATPEMRDTAHLFLDMWVVSETLREWLQSKKKSWRKAVLADVLDTVMPALRFDRSHEETYKGLKAELPKHKQRYAAGGKLELRFPTKPDLQQAIAQLAEADVAAQLADGWAHRSITRDIKWGIELPEGDPELAGKTLYVWPDSLLAPLAFSQLALQERGEDPERYREFWRREGAQVYQFLGQDNVFFYVLMQGAMWLGMQEDPHRLPIDGELRMTEVFGCFHLMVEGRKMSKSLGNFFTGEQLLDERGYDVDQLRYYLCLLGLGDKSSDFDFAKLDDRNQFLAGPLNSAFERPISAAHSKFDGKVPDGELIDDIEKATVRMVQRYVRAMEKANYPSMLFELENYARKINSLFTKHKPHDDRRPEEARRNALYSSFYVLKSLMIMLYPFVPGTMDRLRVSLRLPEDVFRIQQLGTPIPAGHAIGEKGSYFPSPDQQGGKEAT